MKKSIVFFLSLAVVASLHAATVDWASGNVGGSKSDITSITAYYYVISATTYAELASLSNDALAERFVKNGQVQTDDQAISAAEELLGAGTGEKQDYSDWVSFYAEQNVDDSPAHLLMVYVADSSFGGSYAVANVAKYAYNEENGFAYQDADASVGTSGAAEEIVSLPGGWAAVPEPTTIAFLALGLAAIGLKRKVA